MSKRNGSNVFLSGVAEIADGRWIHWALEWSTSSNHCVLKLIEKWFARDISDNIAHIEFDGKTKKNKKTENCLNLKRLVVNV